MKKKNRFQMKSKQLLIILSFLCISGIALTFFNILPLQPVRNIAGYVIVPFQNGINGVGNWLNDKTEYFQNAKKLSDENKALQDQINTLKEENSLLSQDQEQLSSLKSLYQLDQEYPEYEKVAAEVIAKDAGNWYNSFTINRGTDQGIAVDMNVISDGGLVGIITEVGNNWSTVRSIIDDTSNVSAMTISNNDTCIVSGNLDLMEEGKLEFGQMSAANSVTVGEKIVTSSISDKYLKGILIGYVSDVTEDTNHLTNTGHLIPVVDFAHIQDVLVIKALKTTGGQ
ncbi:MAG: rod shape-determining protein MreC [Lachnospiraceae bacterium]|nr:rod shape-determining protein MreC [Lachnospiraceae bacterium]